MSSDNKNLLTRVVSQIRGEFPGAFHDQWHTPDASFDQQVDLVPHRPTAAALKLVSSEGAVWIFVEGFTNESPEDEETEAWTLEFCLAVARYGLYVRAGVVGGGVGRRLFVSADPPVGHERMIRKDPW